MPDEVKLEPCPKLVEALKSAARFNAPGVPGFRRVGFILPEEIAWPKGKTGFDICDALLAAIEATRPTAATDDVVKELVEALDKCRAIIKFHVKNSGVCCTLAGSDKPFSALEAFEGAVDALTLARTGVTLNG